jgi:O-methyltransferase
MTSMPMSPGQGGPPPNRARLQELIGSMRVTQLIYVAATLGIAEQLKDGPKSIAELASTAAVDPNALYRVLRALASHGIFAETGESHFALTPQAELLREDVPGSLRAWAMMLGGESFWKPWGELLACVKTGETAFNRVFGMGRWEYLAAHPDAAETFNRMAASNTDGRATPILEAYDFSAATTVIDLGGGRGVLLAAILAKHPGVKGVLTDLPAVVDEATAFIATQGLGARCAVVGNDLLASVPEGGDIYVMKSVLHGLNDDQAVAVLKHCRAVMTASAKLLVIEAVLPPHGSPSPLINMLDVHRMVMTGSQERSQEELRAFLETAGFTLHRVIQTGTQDNIFEALPVEPRRS